MYAVIRIKSLYSWLWSFFPFVMRSTFHAVVEHLEGEKEFLRTALAGQKEKTKLAEDLLEQARQVSLDRKETIDGLHRKLLAEEQQCGRLAQLLRQVDEALAQWKAQAAIRVGYVEAMEELIGGHPESNAPTATT